MRINLLRVSLVCCYEEFEAFGIRMFRNPSHRATNLAVSLLLLSLCSQAMAALDDPVSATSVTNSAPGTDSLPSEEDKERWSFSAAAYTYVVPDDREYVQPTFNADRGWLHLEARYNYEALETGSAWLGYNLGGGDKLAWEITPMFGGVFGETTGFAPGYKGSVSWWKLELYSEGEYVVDTGDSSDSFFYNWSELSISPLDWFRIGMVTQRTRLYDSDREVQRGVLAGVTYKALDFTTYVFNPDDSDPIFVFSLGVNF